MAKRMVPGGDQKGTDDADQNRRAATTRRRVLTAAGAAVAGLVVYQTSEPTQAAGTVTLANDAGSALNNETVSTYIHNTGVNTFKHTDAALLGESDNGRVRHRQLRDHSTGPLQRRGLRRSRQ